MTRKRNPVAELVRELYGGEVYEYIPLGEYIVAAPGVCGGEPTIKYRRLRAADIIGCLEAGDTPEEIARNYRLPLEAIAEVIARQDVYDYERSYA